MADDQMNIALASERRRMLLSIRLFFLSITALSLISYRPTREYEIHTVFLLSIFFLSIIAMFFLCQALLQTKLGFVLIFFLDTFFVSCGLYLTGFKAWNLMALYFFTILICAQVWSLKECLKGGKPNKAAVPRTLRIKFPVSVNHLKRERILWLTTR